MGLGVMLVAVWFALVAMALVRQFLSGALSLPLPNHEPEDAGAAAAVPAGERVAAVPCAARSLAGGAHAA